MENKNWFVHVEWVVVLVTLLGGFYTLDSKIERQGARTDKLYEMYVKTTEKSDSQWKDLLMKYAEIKCEKKS